MIISMVLMAILGIITLGFTQQTKFGKLPTGVRKKRILNSPNYTQGAFQNRSKTPTLTGGRNILAILWEMYACPQARTKPKEAIPSIKTNLQRLNRDQDILVWFGHAAFFMQIDGKRFLVDPVFSGAASPVPFTTNAFKGSDIYSVADLPEIDYLIITHDHWDHLDYLTLMALKPKVDWIFCGLGTGAHLEHWGFESATIIEQDWYDHIAIHDGFTLHFLPSRHFSGRGLIRNQALWGAFVIQTPTMKFYLSGDSGYDSHFLEAGKQFGGFDLAILESGQYNPAWQYVHMMPAQTLQAARDLNAKRFMPIHAAKFVLSTHAWDEPYIQLTQLTTDADTSLITPLIGETVHLKDPQQIFSQWWRNIQ